MNKNFILSLNIGTVRTMVRTFNSRKIMTWIQRRIFIFSFGGVNKYMGGGGAADCFGRGLVVTPGKAKGKV